jgi:hypothetical protein
MFRSRLRSFLTVKRKQTTGQRSSVDHPEPFSANLFIAPRQLSEPAMPVALSQAKSLFSANVLVQTKPAALLTASLAILLSGSIFAQDLVPSADGVVRGGHHAQHVQANGTSLIVKNSAYQQYDRSSYLKFDLKSVDGDIARAMLVLSVRSLDGDTSVAISASSDAWDEKNLRWAAQPKQGSVLATKRILAAGTREVLIDVSDYIRAQARGDGIASFVLTAPESNGRYLNFYSRKSKQSPLLLIDRAASTAKSPSSMASAAYTEPTSWTFCANDEQRCYLPGAANEARLVRYGANGNYVRRVFFRGSIWDSIGCDIRLFKVDPAPGVAKRCEYSAVLFNQISPSTNPMGPSVNNAQIPVGDPGTSQVLARPTTELPGPSDGTGAFRLVCMFSHMNFDDPIVYPGQVGRSHLHSYFGNTLANAHSTAQSLSTSGNSTCGGGLLNRSSYWVPSIVDTRTGRPVAPRSKTGYSLPASSIKYLPQGLRMIAGNMLASADQDFSGWSCGEHTLTGGSIPPNCPAGQDLSMHIIFPQCWDGVNLDSTNHKTHMAYPQGGACPTSHPIALPEITFNVHYPVPDSSASTYWRLSSDMYGTDRPGGFSIHGDWYNAWDETAMRSWVDGCDVPARDCHAHLLGDGREIYFDPTVHQVEPAVREGSAPKLPPRN